jgi:hypothetical protein
VAVDIPYNNLNLLRFYIKGKASKKESDSQYKYMFLSEQNAYENSKMKVQLVKNVCSSIPSKNPGNTSTKQNCKTSEY